MSSHLLLSDQMSDVTLKVPHAGYSWRFPAHSLLLQSQSPKFREMIEERSNDEHPVTITLLGMHPDTVLAVLKYLYTGEFPSNITTDLLLAAEKFVLKDLREHAEDELLPSLTVSEACYLLESFEKQQPQKTDCAVKNACFDVIEKHAYRVFATDLVLGLSRKVLVNLLCSDNLNVPEESILFWGVWRWGRKHCCQNNRPLTDDVVASYLDDMLVLIRMLSIRQSKNIPAVALSRFSRCVPRRCRYMTPDDSLEQSSTWRTCDTWVDLVDVVNGERGNLCLQVSFSRTIMLVGLALEMCAQEQSDVIIQLIRESDGKELSRQAVDCFRCDPNRKLSRTVGVPEPWLEANVVLSEPLILPRLEIYSVYLSTRISSNALPRAILSPHRRRVDSTIATRHGHAVVAVRELYFVPDIETTWGLTEI